MLLCKNALAGGILIFIILLCIAVCAFYIITYWKVYQKANKPGWGCIIPIYNLILYLQIAKLSPWLVFVFAASCIPHIGSYIVIAFQLYVTYCVGRAFNKSTGFIIGMMLLPFIFIPILAFGNSTYAADEEKVIEIDTIVEE
ncbi:MAG: signal peptidase I [Muribaculaceae bacterium]|nr:signal peptidase I [Muribaculaceae bacterium]